MDGLVKNTATMAGAATAIAVELGAELTRLHGGVGWIEEMKVRLLRTIKNGRPADAASIDDERIFYQIGLGAVEVILHGIRAQADLDGFGGNSDAN